MLESLVEILGSVELLVVAHQLVLQLSHLGSELGDSPGGVAQVAALLLNLFPQLKHLRVQRSIYLHKSTGNYLTQEKTTFCGRQ